MKSWKPPIAPRKRWPWEYLNREIEFGTEGLPCETVAFLRIVKFKNGMGRIVPGQMWTFGLNTKIYFNGIEWTESPQRTLQVKKEQDIQYLVAASINGKTTFLCPRSLRSIKDILQILEDAVQRERRYKNQSWS